MRLLRQVFPLLGLVLVVAACSTGGDGGGGGPITRDIPSVPEGDEYQDMTAITRTIDGGDSASFRFDTFSADDEAIFFVASDGDLYLEDGNFNVLASSSTPTYFAEGAEGIIPVNVKMDAQALGPVNTVCIGPCIILEQNQVPRYVWVTVENPFSTEISVSLYAFSQSFDDVSEPQNDSPSGADELPQDGLRGALETIGDVDFFEVNDNTAVTVSAPIVPSDGFPSDYLTIEAAVVDDAGELVDLPGQANPVEIAPDGSATFDNVFAGEFIRVRAVDDRAGSSTNSDYTVFPSIP